MGLSCIVIVSRLTCLIQSQHRSPRCERERHPPHLPRIHLRRPSCHCCQRRTQSQLRGPRLQRYLARSSQAGFPQAHKRIRKGVRNDNGASFVVPPNCECGKQGDGFEDPWVLAEPDCVLFDELAFEAEEHISFESTWMNLFH